MAIAEHTPSSSSPFRQHRPTGWVTFTAATPLLALQLALLAALVMATDPSPSPELVELTLLTGAREKGAGSYGAIYLASLLCFLPLFVGLFTHTYVYMHALQCAWMEARRATTCREASAPDPTAGSSIFRLAEADPSIFPFQLQVSRCLVAFYC
jgi:hypothetical protein